MLVLHDCDNRDQQAILSLIMISKNIGLNWEEFHLMFFDASPFRLQAAVAIAFAKATVSLTIIPSLMLAAVMSGGAEHDR